MKEENTYMDFEALVALYLSGHATDEEVARLEDWVKRDPAMKATFVEIRNSWRSLEALQKTTDTDRAWEKISQELQFQPSATRVIALKKEKQFANFWKIAAAFLVLVIGLYSVFYFTQLREKTYLAEQPATEFHLSDGSQIVANAGASVRYPQRFSGPQRRVSLEGEAFFRVQHRADQPFVVEAHGLEIRVLGTSFLVKALSQSAVVEVYVESGKVALALPGVPELILTTGGRGIYNRLENTLQHAELPDANILSWKTRVMQFENTPLDEVFRVIGNTYGRSFALEDPRLSSCTLTATFRNQSLEDVLTIVSETFSLRYLRSQDTLKVRGEPCLVQP
ncbi:MAG: FecR domain-containing protein [Bacteroidales bacterium]